MFKVGSGEVFSIDEPAEKEGEDGDDDDEWQDVEVSEDWGPQTPMTQTPMTPLNDDPDELLPIRTSVGGSAAIIRQPPPLTDQHRFPVMNCGKLCYQLHLALLAKN